MCLLCMVEASLQLFVSTVVVVVQLGVVCSVSTKAIIKKSVYLDIG